MFWECVTLEPGGAELSKGSLQQPRKAQINGVPIPIPKTSTGRGCPGWTSPFGMSHGANTRGRALGLTVLQLPEHWGKLLENRGINHAAAP